MGDWNLGSVAATVLDLVPDIPTAISGTRLLEMADRRREFCSDWTGRSIGSNSIGILFQDTVTNLTASDVAQFMSLTGTDATEMKLGEFTVKKGQGSNLDTMSKFMKDRAMETLKSIGRKQPRFKANG